MDCLEPCKIVRRERSCTGPCSIEVGKMRDLQPRSYKINFKPCDRKGNTCSDWFAREASRHLASSYLFIEPLLWLEAHQRAEAKLDLFL